MAWVYISVLAQAHYLPGTTGWGSTFGGRQAVLWNLEVPYNCTTNNGTINITKYTGSGGAVTIPSAIHGLPFTSLPVTSIGNQAFSDCTNLTSVTIPNSVTSIGGGAFSYCTSLTNVTISSSVTNIGSGAFSGCGSLTGVYFQGNVPSVSSSVFSGANQAAVYYLPGCTGWGSTFAGRPAVVWNPLVQTRHASFGLRTNQFGFNITWATSMVIVVEACTNLANPAWSPVGTNTLNGGSSYFSDPQWTTFPSRFYRLRSQ